MMSSDDNNDDRGDGVFQDRSERLHKIIHEHIVRRAAGETVSDQAFLNSHPDLEPELAETLRGLRLIDSAFRQVDGEAASKCRGLRIRCPHCHDPMRCRDDTPPSEMICPSCGSAFGLVDEISPTQKGTRVGHFELLNKVGVGAFGSVWSARDTELDRLVAIKIPRKSHLASEDIEQFIREARAAAQLSHPHIVQVHEVGREEDRVYLVTDYVEGQNLADWLQDHRVTPREAATLCTTLADALEHAHQRGVIHRDLKPSNIILDMDGEPRLMDFGLAKRAAAEVTMTLDGKLLGTPAYMSPEQARGDASHADRRSDIYSLGVILFELVTGRRPFRGSTRLLLHQILLEDAPGPRRLNKHVPKDLETICLKTLEKDPADRYQTAAELAAELRRHLNNEPIHARQPSVLDRTAKWIRRHQTLARAVAAVLLITTACLVVSTVLIAESLRRTRLAQQQALRQRDAALDNLYVANVRLAQEEWHNGNLTPVEQLLDGLVPAEGRDDLRGWEWHYLRSLCHRDVATLRGHTEGVLAVAWSPDGQRLASAGRDFTVRVWNAVTHEELAVLQGHRHRVHSVAWSPDGNQIASTGADKTVRVWDVAAGETVLEIPASDRSLWQVVWSPDGSRLATCDHDSLVKVWDAKIGKELLQMKGHIKLVWSLAWSPDGRRLATVGSYWSRNIRVWDAETGRQIKEIPDAHGHGIRAVAWSPDGRELATGSMDQTVRVWDTQTGERRLTIDAHNSRVSSVSWSPDGTQLVTAGGDGSVKTWCTRDGQLLNVLRGHLGPVGCVRWKADGKQLASASDDHTVKIWDPHENQTSTIVSRRGGFSWSPDGRLLATAKDKVGDELGSVLQIVDVESSTSQLLPFPLLERRMQPGRIAWSPDGSRIACTVHAPDAYECVTKVFDRATLAEIYSLEVLRQNDAQEVRSIAWSPDARYLATAMFDGPDGYVILWDMSNGKEVVRLKHDGRTDSVAWSPKGTRVATSSWDQIVKIWEVGTWRELLRLNCHPGARPITAGGDRKVAWTPDGKRVAAGSVWGWVIMWDATTGREVLSFKAHTAPIRSIAISPDGSRIATASRDRTVKVWDTAGRQLLTLRGHDKAVDSVAWSPSGAWLISSGGDGLRIWDGSRDMDGTD